MTQAEVFRLFQGQFPPGYLERVLDFRPAPLTPDWYEELYATSQGLAIGVGQGEQLELERNPQTAVQKLPDFEGALGLTATRAVASGNVAARQGQIVGKFREAGDASFQSIRAIAQPFLNYTDPSAIVILETDRAQLTAAHTYSFTGSGAIPSSPSQLTLTCTVNDGPMCGQAGAQVLVNLTGALDQVTIYLHGPTTGRGLLPFYGPAHSVYGYGPVGRGHVTAQTLQLNYPIYKDQPIAGVWQLMCTSNAPGTTLNSASIFVEGIGFNGGSNGLGGAAHLWAVVYDPTKVAAGQSADIAGLLTALLRIKPAHTDVEVVIANGTNNYAIPNTQSATPDQGIPGP